MSELSLKQSLRDLGFKLATAEMYGTSKDVSRMKNAHRVLLRKFYNGHQR